MYRIGIDVGGTFTDVVAVDAGGRLAAVKVLSTPPDPSVGVLEGLEALARRLGRTRPALLGETDRLVHGTTVATNALVERRGARVGLVTTEGHRDVLEMREGLKEDRYNLRMPPPVPLVPRALRLGVRERIRWDGTVEVPLDRASLRRAIRALRRARVDAVAVCYLHAYRAPTHESMTKEALAAAMPGAYLSVSSEVLPQIKEYERVCTTVVNAYVGPVLSRYLTRLEERLREAGYAGEVLVIQSHGGVATVPESVRVAAGAILSGPAAGLAAARRCAVLLGVRDLITFDMGGTSTDIALLEDGALPLATDRVVCGHRVALPALDIHTVGAGGGSVATVDAGGLLHVGPQSAGADPGPACYGRGGEAATVTDANVVLGYLDPESVLGGRVPLDAGAARRAIQPVASALGCTVEEAAFGIHAVVTTTMAEGIRLVAARRGVDLRRFTLLAFGGAAGLHVGQVARALEIRRVVIPRAASVLSAWGMLVTDLRYEAVRTHVGELRQLGGDGLRRLFAEMSMEARFRAGRAFDGPGRESRSLDMRYGEQVFEISVPLDGIDLGSADVVEQIVERFHRRHEALYTYSAPDQDVVLVNARLTLVGELPPAPAEPPWEAPGLPRPPGRRRVYLGTWREVPVVRWEGLGPGTELEGPAIIEADTTTVVVGAGDRLRVTPQGWLDVRVGPEE